MDLAALLVIAGSAAAGSLLKGVTGVGGPMISVPVTAAVLGVERAVVVMAISGIVMNGYLIWQYRDAGGETRDLPVLTVTGIAGVAVGTWALAALAEPVLSGFLAFAILAYLAARLLNPTFEISPRASRLLSPLAGAASGLMQGSTGISAPVVATYVHGLNLSRPGYVLAVSILFQVFTVAQVLVIAAVGLYTPARLVESLVASAAALALLPVGDRIGRRLSARSFNVVVLASLAALAAKLLVDVAVA